MSVYSFSEKGKKDSRNMCESVQQKLGHTKKGIPKGLDETNQSVSQ